MSIKHHIDQALVEITVRGQLSIDELLGGFQSMVDDPDLPSGGGLLIDVSASETLPPAEVLKQIASILRDRCDGLSTKVAVLVANPVRYGLARQMGAWLEPCGITTRPFHERAPALEWLAEG